MGTPTWQNIEEIDDVLGVADFVSMPSIATQSQYASSPHMVKWIEAFRKEIDASEQLDDIYKNVFDIYSAKGKNLDTWGRIVGIDRVLTTGTTQIRWDDDAYRFLILYKALANISDATADTITNLLYKLFNQFEAFSQESEIQKSKEKKVYVFDNQNMTLTITLLFYPTEQQMKIIETYGLLCRGAGVYVNFYPIEPLGVFGFDGSELQPFDCAPFIPDWSIDTKRFGFYGSGYLPFDNAPFAY